MPGYLVNNYLICFAVTPLAGQLKQASGDDRSRSTMIAKRLHSDLDTDEDLEDNTTKDQG